MSLRCSVRLIDRPAGNAVLWPASQTIDETSKPLRYTTMVAAGPGVMLAPGIAAISALSGCAAGAPELELPDPPDDDPDELDELVDSQQLRRRLCPVPSGSRVARY